MFRFLANLFKKGPESSQKTPESSQKGGYGGPMIPDGTVLPGAVEGPPTHGLVEPGIAGMRKGPAIPGSNAALRVPDEFAFTTLSEVKNPTNLRDASITNGYDRDILLKGPVLTLFLKKGETRTIKSPVYQRVPKAYVEGERWNPDVFDIVGHSAVDVLRDMAAERTRSILRDQPPEKWTTDVDLAALDEILKLSKFTVQEL